MMYLHPEDLSISIYHYKHLTKLGFKFPSPELALQFSLEGNRTNGQKWYGQFGFHDFKETDITAWKDNVKYDTHIMGDSTA